MVVIYLQVRPIIDAVLVMRLCLFHINIMQELLKVRTDKSRLLYNHKWKKELTLFSIVAYKQQYEGVQLSDGLIKKFRDDFIFQMSIDEGVGFQDRSSMEDATQEYETYMYEIKRKTIINHQQHCQTKPRKTEGEKKPQLEHENMLKAWAFFDRQRKKT